MNYAARLAAGAVSYMVLAHYQGKPIHYIFKRTKKNFDAVERIKNNVPQYSPTIYLPSGYLKTISNYAKVKDTDYRRQIFKVYGDGQLAVDHFPKQKPEISKSGMKPPLVVIIPGFGTDSSNSYIYDTVQSIYESMGWHVSVFNQKGVAKVPFTGNDLLGYWNTRDLEIVLKELSKEYDDIHLIGFSIGANLLQTYLSDIWDHKREIAKYELKSVSFSSNEQVNFKPEFSSQPGQKSSQQQARPSIRDVSDISIIDKICSSVCISPIYHFESSSKLISSKRWVDPVLKSKLDSYIKYNMQFEDFKNATRKAGITEDKIKKMSNFKELSQFVIQAVLNEPDTSRALNAVSPLQHLRDMNTRMLCISSLDDPIVDSYHLPIDSAFTNESLLLALVTSGGHISYSHGLLNTNWSILMAMQYMREQQADRRPRSMACVNNGDREIMCGISAKPIGR